MKRPNKSLQRTAPAPCSVMPLATSLESSVTWKVKSVRMFCAGETRQAACPRSAQFAAAELQRSAAPEDYDDKRRICMGTDSVHWNHSFAHGGKHIDHR